MPCPPSAEADDYQFYTGLERLIYTGSSQQHPGRTEYFIPSVLPLPPPAGAPGCIVYPGADCAVSGDVIRQRQPTRCSNIHIRIVRFLLDVPLCSFIAAIGIIRRNPDLQKGEGNIKKNNYKNTKNRISHSIICLAQSGFSFNTHLH